MQPLLGDAETAQRTTKLKVCTASVACIPHFQLLKRPVLLTFPTANKWHCYYKLGTLGAHRPLYPFPFFLKP